MEFNSGFKGLNETWILWTEFWKTFKYKKKKFMKTHPEGADLFQADRWTGMTKVVVAFRNFANASRQMTDSYSGCSVDSITILTDITGEGEGGEMCFI